MAVRCRLKEIRMKEYMKNLTEFADMLGYDISTVSGWEKDKVRPELERSLDVAKKLNKHVDDIWYLE
jgi:DNA-binding XRE family transcriptional regulator